MKKFLSTIVCLVISVAAFAYDFTGKTFRGTTTINGTKVTITYKFNANNRLTGTLAMSGSKPDTDSGMYWEVSGDFINYYDSTGDYGYMQISEENGETVLIAFDSQGNPAMTFKQVKNTSSKKKK